MMRAAMKRKIWWYYLQNLFPWIERRNVKAGFNAIYVMNISAQSAMIRDISADDGYIFIIIYLFIYLFVVFVLDHKS